MYCLRATHGSLVMAALLAGCGGSTGTDGSAQSALPPSAATTTPTQVALAPVLAADAHGHFRGTATRAGQTYHVEALLTDDMALRLYVGGPVPVESIESGAGVSAELLAPSESLQFVANATTRGSELVAKGRVIGQLCTPSSPQLLCGEDAVAELRVEVNGSSMELPRLFGELRVVAREGELVWIVDLASWSASYRGGAATLASLAGTTLEQLAPFAQGDDVVVTVDNMGRLFFQAPSSGCIGNGRLAPHGDGSFGVLDVELSIESCRGEYAYLNGEFTGLATSTQNGYWDYDSWRLMLVSTLDGVAALTLLGSDHEASAWDY